MRRARGTRGHARDLAGPGRRARPALRARVHPVRDRDADRTQRRDDQVPDREGTARVPRGVRPAGRPAMSDEQRDDERMRELLGARSRSVEVPPFDTLPRSAARSIRRSVAVTLAVVAVAVAALYGGRELSTFRQQQAPPTAGVAAPSATAAPKGVLPQPVPQPITRTSAGAQVAWVSTSELHATQTERLTVLVGVDPAGKIVGRIDGAIDPFAYRAFRSADGALLITVGDTAIRVYSALDGTLQRTFARPQGDGVLDVAFSPDGRWLALIGSAAYVQVLDLRTRLTQTTPLGHDPNPQAPGVTRAPGSTGLIWFTLVFSPDAKRLYTIVDLRSDALLGRVPTPTKVDQPGPFSWLFPVANAGGTPSTVPLSPDGLRLYSVGNVGITVLRVPDLKPIATLASGLALSEVWVSGDGKTVYATDRGKNLYVLPDDGGPPITVTMPIPIGGFFASEHG